MISHFQLTKQTDTAVAPQGSPLAPEGTVFRRRRLQLDRLAQGARSAPRARQDVRQPGPALPVQHAGDEGGLPRTLHLPETLSKGERGEDCVCLFFCFVFVFVFVLIRLV